jgi:hypothetical protein
VEKCLDLVPYVGGYPCQLTKDSFPIRVESPFSFLDLFEVNTASLKEEPKRSTLLLGYLLGFRRLAFGTSPYFHRGQPFPEPVHSSGIESPAASLANRGKRADLFLIAINPVYRYVVSEP